MICAPVVRARATYYVAMGLMDTQNGLGEQFHSADLRYLADRGHEIAIHGFNHLSARNVPLDEFVEDVVKCERAIHQRLPAGASKNFAYPYGQVTLRAKRRIGAQMGSSRSTLGGLNGPGVDLNLLRANSLYGDIDQVERVRQLVMKNQARKSWLIFYSHDVAEKPSPCGCTPSLLEEAVSFVANQGMKVMTVAEVATRLCPTV